MKNIIALFLAFFISHSFTYPQTGFRIKQLANINTHPNNGYSALWGWTAPNGREYAILGCYTGTAFIDITDTLNIHEVDFLPARDPFSFGNGWREMKTYSHYCYIISEAVNSKIQIVDLQYLPDSIRYVGPSNIPNHSTTHSISQSGPYLYLNGCNEELSEGIAIVDLSIPEIPTLRGKWDDLYVHDSRIVNDTIWACNIDDGKVSIIDARNKDSMKTIRNWTNAPLPNAPHNIALTNNRNYAYVTDEVSHPPGKMKIWNVSDLDNITYITSFNPYPFENSIVHNVEIYNNYAFVAYYSAGVKVLNITNPENPVELGWFDTYPETNANIFGGCWGVYYFPSGKIIASDMFRGLFVLRPNLSMPIPGIPKANFTVAQTQVYRWIEEQTFIDMTEGIPTGWQWTITGPENMTSNLRNPSMVFSELGDYNVKLKASNSFGTDSIIKTNFFRVVPVSLANFVTTNPPGPSFRILTSPGDTSKVLFNWRRSVNSPDIFYKIYFKRTFGTPEEFILSGNNGRDSSYFLSSGYLDSMALRFGLNGDSVLVRYRVIAYNETDSLISGNSVTLILKRNTVGISTINEFLPKEYKLFNNYPNPFNPTTNILFDIPKQGEVKLILYDLTGREIFKLFNEYLNAGSYKYSFNMGNLNSGAYFVKIKAGEFTSAIKIVLIK